MAKADSKSRLLELIDRLPPAQQAQLAEFAEFLSERHPVEEPVNMERVDIPRPSEETVVAAMKRLRDTYPMLDPEQLLNEASGLMSAHLLQGKAAETVIDELEQLFRQHYESMQV